MSSIIPFRDTKLIYRLFTNLIIKDVKVLLLCTYIKPKCLNTTKTKVTNLIHLRPKFCLSKRH